jgi:hypothetical protein
MAVYFIAEEGTEHVKIGCTRKSVWERLDQLQSGNDRQLILMRVIEGEPREEWYTHRAFAHLRISGEWFTYSDDMWNYGSAIDVGPRPKSMKTGRPKKQRLSFEHAA